MKHMGESQDDDLMLDRDWGSLSLINRVSGMRCQNKLTPTSQMKESAFAPFVHVLKGPSDCAFSAFTHLVIGHGVLKRAGGKEMSGRKDFQRGRMRRKNRVSRKLPPSAKSYLRRKGGAFGRQ